MSHLGVTLSAAVLQAERRACPERSRTDLRCRVSIRTSRRTASCGNPQAHCDI